MACRNSPENTDVTEKSLSPVLGKSRSFRKVLHVKKGKQSSIRANLKQSDENIERIDNKEFEIVQSEKLGENLPLLDEIEKLKKWKVEMEKNYEKIAYNSTDASERGSQANGQGSSDYVQNQFFLEETVSKNHVAAIVNRDLEPTLRIFTKSSKKAPGSGTNIFGDENFDDLKLQENFTAFQKSSFILTSKSGNCNFKLEPDKCAEKQCVKKAPNIFHDEQPDFKLPEGFNDFEKCPSLIEKVSGGKNIFENENFNDLKVQENFKAFQKSSSILIPKKGYSNSKQYIKKASNIFNDEQLDDLKLPEDFNGFEKCSLLINKGSRNKKKTAPKDVSNDCLQEKPNNTKGTFKCIFGDENFDDLKLGGNRFGGFVKASEKDTKLSKDTVLMGNIEPKIATVNEMAVKKKFSEAESHFKVCDIGTFKHIFGDENFDDLKLDLGNCGGFSKASATTVNIDHVNSDFKGFTDSEKQLSASAKNTFYKHISFPNFDKPNMQSKTVTEIRKSDCNKAVEDKSRDIEIRKTQNNANFLKRPKKRLGVHVSPSIPISERSLKRARLLFEAEFSSNPSSTSTPVKTDCLPQASCDLTPIQKALDVSNTSSIRSFASKNSPLEKTVLEQRFINGRLQIQKPPDVNIEQVLHNIQNERRLLEEKLRIISQREIALSNQRQFLLFSRKGVKAKPGVLLVSKSEGFCQSLRTVMRQQNLTDISTDNILHLINPENAAMVHFNVNNIEQPYIRTLDGAEVIPNLSNQIGLSEVERGFQSMEVVEPSLIPKGWIKNHYKWIVWKLASYERRFPATFDRCLSVENVIQQLKYRYDREIDKAERPAIRKILEKDDCSQKRLVLCVSRISRVGTGYELELTDGWYAVRTVIDRPLCNQIRRGKLQVGTKVITCGAELFNCEGCSPLEVNASIYLRISYNSTRRVASWAKLGYQRDPNPFPVSLSSVHLEGGKIGCARFYVARVYPVKYLETVNGKKVWRNEKAEERRTQEWQHENETKLPPSEFKKPEKDKIKDIKDPKTLYDMLQNSNDPEGLQEYLTDSQKESLYSFEATKTFSSDSKNQRNHTARDVTPLLKLRVMDCDDIDKDYAFNVWRPSETHLQLLKEGKTVTAFNVTCSQSWGLGANSHTQFRCEAHTVPDKFDKVKRKFTPIDGLAPSMAFNEFDTVGVLVKKTIRSSSQDFWLANSSERLLLVNIYESPRNISLLGSVEEGDVLTLSNLAFQQAFEGYSCACANFFSIVAKYSRYKHLQNASEALSKELEGRDNVAFLTLCRKKVDRIEEKWSANTNSVWENDEMDSSQLTSVDIALMECMNKLT